MIKKKLLYKAAAAVTAVAVFAGTFLTGGAASIQAETSWESGSYPWTPAAAGTTGDYIADSYEGIEAGHVFESVTQERLLDILSSKGTYYIVFGGPEHETSKTAVPLIHTQAGKDGISKIYHFDPYVDGYQIDITDAGSPFKGNGKSVHELWTRITALLPDDKVIREYRSDDTLLFAYSNDGRTKKIAGSWKLPVSDIDDASTASTAAKAADVADTENASTAAMETEADGIAAVFRDESGAVRKGDIRTDFEFFKRVYNGSASLVETRQGDEATADRIGKSTEIFTDADREGFPLHQVNFNELVNLLNAKGEHYIFLGTSWCHNTQAIIGSVARKAKANGKKVYVYDTTLGNQLTFGTGTDIDKVTATSSALNTRNNIVTEGEKKDNNNISYLYGELVKYFKDFVTENNSNRNNSISYLPNGIVSGSATSVAPWDVGGAGEKNAVRLQLPFLLAYDKDAESPVTRQWLHKNKADDGTYTEYMLELAWVLNTKEASEDVYTNPKARDGLTKSEFAAEAVRELSTVLGAKEPPATQTPPASQNPTQTPPASEPPVTNKDKDGPSQKQEEQNSSSKVKAPGKAKISKVKPKKKASKKVTVAVARVKGSKGYEIQVSKAKKFTKKNLLAKSTSTKTTITTTSKKLKNKKTLYVRVRAYRLNGRKKVYGKWSSVKKVKVS